MKYKIDDLVLLTKFFPENIVVAKIFDIKENSYFTIRQFRISNQTIINYFQNSTNHEIWEEDSLKKFHLKNFI